jgi:zinc protease
MTEFNPQTAVTSPSPFEDRTHEIVLGNCRLIVLPVAVDDVVSFAGAVRTAPDQALHEDLLQELVTLTLDRGTQRRDRFAVADLIDNRGAQIQFRSSPQRITFSGRALTADLPDVVALLAEQLREPLFDPDEVEKARLRYAAELRRSQENTGARATGALSRLIYAAGHPNFIRPAEESLDALNAIAVDGVRGFYHRCVGADQLTFVVVGDVDPATVETVVRENLADWAEKGRGPGRWGVPPLSPAAAVHDVLPAKMNTDVRLGHAVPVKRGDGVYLPLHLATFVLGGNFSARLMNIVRDQMGLTYGISASLTGISVDYTGHFRLAVTLSPDNLTKGVQATMDVVRQYVEEGATDEEVQAAKETVRGSFVVELATTGGLAHTLLINHLRGFGTEYMDRFRDEVGAVGTDEVNAALRQYLHPDRLHTAYSGAAAVDH